MARTNTYGHYCAAARALEMIGEKWSLLIVRDLLHEPQRFSDLLRSLGGVTPKLLTQRLRDLEAAGVVERDEEPGRREVWYRLTAVGQELQPVLEALLVWGVMHAAAPRPGEAVDPRRAARTAAAVFNRRGVRPSRPLVVGFRFGTGGEHGVGFDGRRWTYRSLGDASPDVDVGAATTTWVDFLRASPSERERRLDALAITGPREAVADFRAALLGMNGDENPTSP